MPGYASQTTVSEEKSQAEIVRFLLNNKGTNVMAVHNPNEAGICFAMNAKIVRMLVWLPPTSDPFFKAKRRLAPSMQQKRWEQEKRRRWRALFLAIKSRIEEVNSGISTFESSFMPFIVMSDGQTVGEHILPKLMEGGSTPSVLALPWMNDKALPAPH